MEWIVKIEKTPDVENEIEQRIRIVFNPTFELIDLYGEAKVKNNRWFIFSEANHEMTITLEQLQEKMSIVVKDMRKRLVEYENLNKGFTVLKWVAFEEENVDE
jgi:hypothetical protein